MSAQPVHQESDPWDPQVIHDLLPENERPMFLEQVRTALSAARDDISQYKDLQELLQRWRLVAEALNDPGYYERLEEARTATTPGLSLAEVEAMRRAG